MEFNDNNTDVFNNDTDNYLLFQWAKKDRDPPDISNVSALPHLQIEYIKTTINQTLNGTNLNGTSLNGTSLNGTDLNSTDLNGTSPVT